jgi:hypothetical protein
MSKKKEFPPEDRRHPLNVFLARALAQAIYPNHEIEVDEDGTAYPAALKAAKIMKLPKGKKSKEKTR